MLTARRRPARLLHAHETSTPVEPLILGLILGGKMEQAYRQALIISEGSNSIFLEKPISLLLLVAAIGFLMLPMILKKSKQFTMARATAEGA